MWTNFCHRKGSGWHSQSGNSIWFNASKFILYLWCVAQEDIYASSMKGFSFELCPTPLNFQLSFILSLINCFWNFQWTSIVSGTTQCFIFKTGLAFLQSSTWLSVWWLESNIRDNNSSMKTAKVSNDCWPLLLLHFTFDGN